MRDMNAVQVLTIIIDRLERRADALEGVRMPAFDVTIQELRKFADMMKRARIYLERRANR